MRISAFSEFISVKPLSFTVNKLSTIYFKRKPFFGMAFLLLALVPALGGFAQSSSKYIRTSVTETGKVHFIKPLEMKGTRSSDLSLDITVTETANAVDSAIINFTFTTSGSQPRLDSAQLVCGDKTIHIASVANYFVERKGNSWVSRNGMRLTGDELKWLLSAPDPLFRLFPKEQSAPEIFSASTDWKKMAPIAIVILFP